jgi:hypothetical protein
MPAALTTSKSSAAPRRSSPIAASAAPGRFSVAAGGSINFAVGMFRPALAAGFAYDRSNFTEIVARS